MNYYQKKYFKYKIKYLNKRYGQEGGNKFELTIPSFINDEIPIKNTCDGDDEIPTMSWSGVPSGTESFAMIVDDPDAKKAPGGIFTHFVICDIPAEKTSLGKEYTDYGVGKNTSGEKRFKGPCPPVGDNAHHYHFTLFALDVKLELKDFNKETLMKAMNNHILGEAKRVASYSSKYR